MKNKEAIEARKPELLFDSKQYKIEKIPLNYRITINLVRKIERAGIDRECYSPLQFGLEYAHDTAKDMIERHFTLRLQSQVARKHNFGK